MIILLMSTKNNHLYMWKYIIDALKYSDSYKKFKLNFDADFK